MSWSSDLWDQWDSLLKYSEVSIGCIDKYGEFLRRRSRIEMQYATQLQQLTNHFEDRINSSAKHQKGISNLTWHKSLLKVLETNKQLANQHEMVSKGLSKLATEEVVPCVANLKAKQQTYLREMEVCQQNFKESVRDFSNMRDQYSGVSNIDKKQSLKKLVKETLCS